MGTRFESAPSQESSGVGRKLRIIGGTALAGIVIAGGGVVAWAYHDLKQGVDGPVFDIHHAETHALSVPEDQHTVMSPADIDTQLQTYSVVFES